MASRANSTACCSRSYDDWPKIEPSASPPHDMMTPESNPDESQLTRGGRCFILAPHLLSFALLLMIICSLLICITICHTNCYQFSLSPCHGEGMCLNFCQSMYCITFDFFRSGKKRTKVIIWLMEREKRDKKCEKNVSIFFPFPSDPTKATTFILTSHGKLIMNKLPLVAKLSSHFSNFFILPPSSSTSSGQ